MDITYDSYNDIKNKCENYDLYTSDFIYGDKICQYLPILLWIRISVEFHSK